MEFIPSKTSFVFSFKNDQKLYGKLQDIKIGGGKQDFPVKQICTSCKRYSDFALRCLLS